MPQTGICTDVTCSKELTELYECHCCSWLICLKHLLEHVEISKRDKNQQLNTLRNDLIVISHTLESIVEKKLHDIECEQQLIQQAKTIIDKSGHTFEEIQSIVEQINQAVIANRTEETIVKVESSLSDVKDCSCDNQICHTASADRSDLSHLCSSTLSNNIFQQIKSPVYHSVRRYSTLSGISTIQKSLDVSAKRGNSFDISNVNNENIDPSKNDENDNSDNTEEIDDNVKSTSPNASYELCPLTFDGAFGLTKAKHSINFCTVGTSIRRGLAFHFVYKHKLKKVHAENLSQAVKNKKDPHTTKLFDENEEVIDYQLYIPCPFSSSMISLIGRCPGSSRNVPCKHKNVATFCLALHLKRHHNLSAQMVDKITKIHKKNLKKMGNSLQNNTHSC